MNEPRRGYGFGTAPVFLAAISTILGAVLFLRFGYALGHVGMLGALAIIVIGHAITIPTGLAVAEIATNLKVEGGGEYYIISRSFGTTVGGAIGISLYLSQAVSVAFYTIAFSEAFRPLFPWFAEATGITPDIRMIGVPAVLLLLLLMVTKGASVGVRALWVVTAVLAEIPALPVAVVPGAPAPPPAAPARTAPRSAPAVTAARAGRVRPVSRGPAPPTPSPPPSTSAPSRVG